MIKTTDQPQASARVEHLKPSLIRNIAEAGMKLDDVIPLWFGEGQWPTSVIASEAAIKALQSSDHFYQPNSGKLAFREAICTYMNKIYGLDLTSQYITVTASGMQGLMLVAQAITNIGDRIVCIDPVWPNLGETFKIAGGNIEFLSLQPTNQHWQLDMDALLSLLTPDTKAVLVNSPNNPTGWVMSAEEQKTLFAHCQKYGIWIVSDDVYSRLYRHGRAAPNFLSLCGEGDRVISVNSFSKAWSMTGWRLGWIVAPRFLETILAQLTELNIACAPGFVQEAGLAMITSGEDEVSKLKSRLHTGFGITKTRLEAMEEVSFIQSDGAFYSFFSVAGVTDSFNFAMALLHIAGIGLAPGTAFSAITQNYLRMCYAQDEAVLTKAFDRLETGIAGALKATKYQR